MYDIVFIGNNDKQWNKLKAKFKIAKRASTFAEAKGKVFTKMFWAVWSDIEVREDFDFDYPIDFWDQEYVHSFLNGDTRDGISLCPRNIEASQEEIKSRVFANKKEVDIVASDPLPFDIYEIDTWEEYQYAMQNSSTEMFWGVSRNIEYNQAYMDNFYFSHYNNYDRKENHAFVHDVDERKLYNGVFLYSKHKIISQEEIENRHLIECKQWDDVLSGPKKYDIFSVDCYKDYEYALNNSKTEMFWIIPSDVIVCDNFKFDLYFSYDNKYDRKTNHVFLNKSHYDGIVLCSKHMPISKREISHRFIVNPKTWDIVASNPKPFDVFDIENYDDYENALQQSSTEMFWMSSANISIIDDVVDNFYISHHDKIDRNQNHAFVHEVNNEKFYNGAFLCSKNTPLSKKEIEYRFPVNRKEWETVVSGPVKYARYYADTYEEYLDAFEKADTELFYIIPTDVDLCDSFDFDIYFTYNNEYDRKINHVFLNGEYHDGVILASKHSKISKREWDYRFIAHKKETDLLVSTPKPYDIVFISYQEPNADENFKTLLERFPRAQRVHGVKGIHQAHIEAAKLAQTENIWIVDGDAIIVDEFNFDYQIPKWKRDHVFVWRSKNPINDMVYGYGGVKLFPKKETMNMDVTKPDMTTSISTKFNAIEKISNITAFNTGPFETWKSAFRECAKLSSKIIDRQKTGETDERLKTWTTVGHDRPFGKYALAGATAGMEFGLSRRTDLGLINDFDWLKEQFDANT